MTTPSAALPVALLLTAACAQTQRPAVPGDVAAHRAIEFSVSEGTQLSFDVNPRDGSIVFDLLGQLWAVPPGGGEARRLTDAVADLAEDSDPAISPDGRWIAFHADRPGGRGLWLVSSDGGTVRPLTERPNWLDTDITPAWSPDGTRIAFVRGPGNDATIHVLRLADSSIERLEIEGLPSPGARHPAWSPDGRHIVFVNAGRWGPGGRIWKVPAGGGTAVPLGPDGIQASTPSLSPDGRLLLFLAPDSLGRQRVRVDDLAGNAWALPTGEGSVPRPVRWDPDRRSVVFGGGGRLWRIAVDGGTQEEIPFTAPVSIRRPAQRTAPIRWPESGRQPARGHMGAAISPDGGRAALIALGRLWIWEFGAEPRPLANAPIGSGDVTWSPDGRRVAWTAGLKGAEDLYATDPDGAMTRLTRLEGAALRPSWSPDGRWIAFVHEYLDGPPTVRVLDANAGRTLTDLAETHEIADRPQSWWFIFPYGQEAPQWSPDAAGVLITAETQWLGGSDTRTVGSWHGLDGGHEELFSDGGGRTFVRWSPGVSLVFIRGNQLWTARLDRKHGLTEEAAVSDDAALYPSVARDGTVLYRSADGFRLARPDGRIEVLGYPLSYDVPGPPEPILIRNVRLIDGTGHAPDGLSDIVIENRRIRRIVPAGDPLPRGWAHRTLDAEGRTAIPGLIDLHAHVWDDLFLPGLLAFGVTAIREASSPIARAAALRDLIDAGLMAGPRVVLGGFRFGGAPSDDRGFTGQQDQNHAPGEIGDRALDRALALARAYGADYVKLYAAGGQAGAWIAERAQAAGMSVSGHTGTSLPLIAAGYSGKEHLGQSGDRSDGMPYDDVVTLFREAGLWVVPTLAVFAAPGRIVADPGILDEHALLLSPFMRAWANPGRLGEGGRRNFATWSERARRGTVRMREGGVTIAAGADLLLPWAVQWEMEELVGVGLSPMEAIEAATRIAAEVLGASAEIGTIEAGKLADLVILDADPLEDIAHARSVWRVVKGGAVIAPGEIREAVRALRDRGGVP